MSSEAEARGVSRAQAGAAGRALPAALVRGRAGRPRMRRRHDRRGPAADRASDVGWPVGPCRSPRGAAGLGAVRRLLGAGGLHAHRSGRERRSGGRRDDDADVPRRARRGGARRRVASLRADRGRADRTGSRQPPAPGHGHRAARHQRLCGTQRSAVRPGGAVAGHREAQPAILPPGHVGDVRAAHAAVGRVHGVRRLGDRPTRHGVAGDPDEHRGHLQPAVAARGARAGYAGDRRPCRRRAVSHHSVLRARRRVRAGPVDHRLGPPAVHRHRARPAGRLLAPDRGEDARSARRAGRLVQRDDEPADGAAGRDGGEEAPGGRAAHRAQDPDVAAAAGTGADARPADDGQLHACA